MTDQESIDLCTDLALAVMSSASTDKIKPIDWWPRLRSALESAGSKAQHIGAFIAEMARKLSIDGALNASTIDQLAPVIERCQDAAIFQQIRKTASRSAIYVTAMAQTRRAADKASRGKA